jgi:acyl dehydratase
MSTQDRKVVEQRGMWLEEFTVGTLYRHRPGRTVTEADNVLFSTLTMNPQPLHLDAVWSGEQVFGQRLVNSLFTLSTLVGLSIGQLTLGTLVANLGFRDVTFPHPVFVGDTLYAESVVTSARPSASRPGEGVIEVEHIARNQDGVIVAQCHRAMLVLRRPAE